LGVPPYAPQSQRELPSRRTLADSVHESIMGLLMDGELEPGSAVNIDALARTLEVSATPVREALARVASTGLLQRTALKGYRVAPPLTREELGLLVDARLAIEPLTTERACQRSDPQLVAQLQRVHAAQVAAPTGPDSPGYRGYRDYLAADQTFHELLNAGSGNPFLAQSFESLNGHLHRFRFYLQHVVDDAPQTRAEHAAILQAVVAGDATAAAEQMRAHLRALLARATWWSDEERQR
jgi:DNA-binding GntR family transcriptional regulator